jgi:uncharacterized protein with HEPN domain/predicted nucleotidyltransferase
LQVRSGVSRLALFRSTAPDTATSGRDVDILVVFDGPATSKRYFGVQFYREDLLGCRVDLVTKRPCGRSCALTSNRSGSVSDASQREWRFYLDDVIGFAGKLLTYTDGLDQAGFVASGLTYDATLRNLELVGEAATHIPDEVRTAHPEIPWRMIIATRNCLIQGYLGIDDDTPWNIIQNDVPELLPMLKALKNEARS